MIFYVGLHHPSDAKHFDYSFVSVNRIRERQSAFQVSSWIMDSGAFTKVTKYGGYPEGPEVYAEQIDRWNALCPSLEISVSEDYMCEPFVIEKTGLSVTKHQELTIERYDQITALTKFPVMPVLQGFKPDEYISHLAQYGGRLKKGARVGVGSVCKRNSHPQMIEFILKKIKAVRPDLKLHGFGLKLTALRRPCIQSLLYSADSMAWSFAARYAGRNANDYREAKEFERRINHKEPDTLTLT